MSLPQTFDECKKHIDTLQEDEINKISIQPCYTLLYK